MPARDRKASFNLRKERKNMRTARNIFWTVALTLGTAAPALAATGRVDKSGVFVWVFLGFCALIIAAQAIPAILMMLGTARAVAKGMKEKKAGPAESEVETK
jgi:hypothetical protein